MEDLKASRRRFWRSKRTWSTGTHLAVGIVVGSVLLVAIVAVTHPLRPIPRANAALDGTAAVGGSTSTSAIEQVVTSASLVPAESGVVPPGTASPPGSSGRGTTPSSAATGESDTEVEVVQTTASGASCGVERWAVKTGTDPEARQVDATRVRDSTIAEMDGFPRPASLSRRNAPVEVTVYRLHTTLVEYKRESDSDLHLVLADAAGNTLIAEIPSPSCDQGSAFEDAIRASRAAFDAGHGESSSFRSTREPVTITGVGFFDFKHGQTGVAPNAVELHPVLSISFG